MTTTNKVLIASALLISGFLVWNHLRNQIKIVGQGIENGKETITIQHQGKRYDLTKGGQSLSIGKFSLTYSSAGQFEVMKNGAVIQTMSTDSIRIGQSL